jgi:hypothetical protein
VCIINDLICSVLISQLSESLGRQATLADAPESFFRELTQYGFKWLYLLGRYTAFAPTIYRGLHTAKILPLRLAYE